MKTFIFKNLSLSVLLFASWFFARSELANLSPTNLDTITLFVGLILVAPLFACFTFSYAQVSKKKKLGSDISSLFWQC